MIRYCSLLTWSAAALLFPFNAVAVPGAMTQGEVLATEGSVQFNNPRTNWIPAQPGFSLRVEDRLRTLDNSRATLQLAELGKLLLNQLTTLEILPPKTAANKATLDLKAGAAYFFTRGKPREFLLQTPYAIGASRGTEFLATVETGRALITVFDGQVELSNAGVTIVLTNGEQGLARPGLPPVKTAVIQAANLVQWWLYYPGILDLDELSLPAAAQTVLGPSLSLYRSGDLLGALQAYPAGRVPGSDAERVYYAALLLSVGQVDKSEPVLTSIASNTPNAALAAALRQVIAVTATRSPLTDSLTHPPTHSSSPLAPRPSLIASEWLSLSYAQQPTNLAAALVSAREAAKTDSSFGFAWERVAELEFSFGRVERAKEALDEALRLSPRNAQALALRGFVLSAENHIVSARSAFQEAIEKDPALGNGWLGRGLCRIRQGDSVGGRADLQTAAALESNRSLFRSYLGKAFANLYDQRHAGQELELALRLDPDDPTPWLYSALLNEQENRLNQGVDDLEKSLELNDNRRVYRSQLLLDQDRAVRSASLATIYSRDGMEAVAVREADRAVNADYANYSAHLFLANSIDALRDPTRFNLRYETPWFNELLLANLLAPVGAGALSQNISQQEYSKLFEANGPGFVADTSWRSDGQFEELASQYGTFGNTSYSLDGQYRHYDGIRRNNSLTDASGSLTLKQQVTPRDSILFAGTLAELHSGDNFQYYNPSLSADPTYTTEQHQRPTLLLGYHREWAPGIHTLILGSRIDAEQRLSDQNAHLYIFTPGNLNFFHLGTNDLGSFPFVVDYHNRLLVYSAEINQIFQSDRQVLVVGGRYQTGEIHAHDFLMTVDPFSQPDFSQRHDVSADFRRATGYAYYTAEPVSHLRLTGGVAYDQVTFPQNFETMPLTSGENTRTDWGPKGALLWTPIPEATIRAAYAHSLGGVSLDQSFRLEPTQLAGFDQSFRDIMPAYQVGPVSAPNFEIAGAALDLNLPTRTYLTIQAERLESDADKTLGLYQFNISDLNPVISMPQHLAYEEKSLTATLNQLVGQEWSLGVQYQFIRSELKTSFPEIPAPATLRAYPDTHVRADLHRVTPFIVFNHPCGFFARAEAPWYSQINTGYHTPFPGDDFVQVNLLAGYRFPHQLGDFTFGLLNVTGRDYRLNPLNVYSELPRSRLWSVRLRISI